MKVGMIGISSYYSLTYARGLRRIDGVDFVSASHENYNEEWGKQVTGLTREEFKNCFGIRMYENAEEMLEKEKLDIVFVCSLLHRRPDDAIMCIKKGIHTFIAKNMAPDLEGARKILKVVKQSNVNVSTASPGLFEGSIWEAYNRVKNGEVGDVLSVRVYHNHGGKSKGLLVMPEFQKEYKLGPEISLGFYNSVLLCKFVGIKPVRVYAEYANLNTKDLPWMDSGKGIVVFENGALGSMDIYFAISYPGAPGKEIEICGTKGMIRTQQGVYDGVLWNTNGNISCFYRNPFQMDWAEIESFIKACGSGKEPELNIDDIYTAFEVCIGWYESSQKHMPVNLPLK